MGDTNNTFDAIVIGSGMSGGWAAKEFCEKGLKTLLLERGRDVVHLKDYPTTNMLPWEFKHRGQVPYEIAKANPVISRCYAFKEDAMHFFVKDTEHPYVQEKPFDWIRGYQVGGKSIMWARQTQRWSDFDFDGPARDGFAVDWPIRYKDLAPWYSYVEKFAGISGNKDGLDTLPDGEFLPAWELSCVENHFKEVLSKNYQDRHVIYGRCAHVTQPQPVHIEQGRGQCQARSLCQRGCPFGGYFNANSTTIPWAQKTGNLTMRTHAIVHSIIYDEAKGKATGVRIIDTITKQVTEYFAPVIFVNAGAINTNLILLNSISKRFPNGLGNDNGLLGKYFAFHNYRARITANYAWNVGSQFMGETIPKETNYVKLDRDIKDEWGMPLINFNVAYDDNDEKMIKDFMAQYTEMFEKAGFTNIKTTDSKQAPGLDIHEMGGVRMGRDPKTSLLNAWNQLHACPNVFVTDGACMTSTSTQNPSLTYMALTARAVDHAVELLKRKEL